MSEKTNNIIIAISKTVMLLCVLAMIFFSVSFFIASVHRQRVLQEKLEHYREVDKKLRKQIKDLDKSK